MKALFLFSLCGTLLTNPTASHHRPAGTPPPAGTPRPVVALPLTLFGRGTYPGDDSTYSRIKTSGFNTIILSSFYIRANGDVYSGDDSRNPLIHEGKYVGNREWLRRVTSLKGRPGSVTRIEILLEGRWYNQPPNTYDFIKDWSDSTQSIPGIVSGTGPGSTLYQIAKVLKEEVGADACCIDDESVYDSPSIIRFGEMTRRLGMHMTLCPFTKMTYWKDILQGSASGLIDAIYLQCYDGGARNTPGPWVNDLGTTVPLYPIFLCRGAFSTCATNHNSKTPDEIRAEMIRFKKEYPGMTGGAIWQMADIKEYVRMNCSVRDPASGTAVSVEQYLLQLKNSVSNSNDSGSGN